MKTPSNRRRERRPVKGGVTHTGVNAVAPKAPRGGAKVSSPKSKAARIADIVNAADRLDPANPGHFTEDGKPDVTALEGLLGWRPAAAERDEAWDILEYGKEN